MTESEGMNNLREIKREFRKNNLDNSILFLCSILGIIFGFLEVYIGGPQSILYFVPILVIGMILPFFHGYLLGSVFLDSSIERVRGWLFLEAGLFLYGANLLDTIIEGFYSEKHFLKIIPTMLIFTTIFYILPKLSSITFRKIFDLCGNIISDLDKEIINLSGVASSLLAIGSSVSVMPLKKGEMTEIIIRIALLATLLFIGLYFYKSSYNFQRKKNNKYKVLYEKGNELIAKLSSLILLLTITIFVIVDNIDIGFSEIIEKNIMIILMAIIGTTGCFIVIFKEKKHIIFEDIS